VRKLTNEKIRWIIRQLNKGTPVREIAAVMTVTPRRIYLLKKCEEAGQIPELKQPGSVGSGFATKNPFYVPMAGRLEKAWR
jgi:hypothetical protein